MDFETAVLRRGDGYRDEQSASHTSPSPSPSDAAATHHRLQREAAPYVMSSGVETSQAPRSGASVGTVRCWKGSNAQGMHSTAWREAPGPGSQGTPIVRQWNKPSIYSRWPTEAADARQDSGTRPLKGEAA